MGDVVCYQSFDIGHDLTITGSGCRGHFGHGRFVGLMKIGGLGEEDKRDGEETFDPFDELITTMGLIDGGEFNICLLDLMGDG